MERSTVQSTQAVDAGFVCISDISTVETEHTPGDEDPPLKLSTSPVNVDLFESSSTPEKPDDDSDHPF